jgi:hypothetical protein
LQENSNESDQNEESNNNIGEIYDLCEEIPSVRWNHQKYIEGIIIIIIFPKKLILFFRNVTSSSRTNDTASSGYNWKTWKVRL